MAADSGRLNENQAKRLRVTCEHIDQLLSGIEHILGEAGSGPAFPRYIPDLTPEQRKTVGDYIARIRARLVKVLDGQGISRRQPMIRASLAISTTLLSMDVSAEEVKPRYMKGYGPLSNSAEAELNGIAGELQSLFMQFHLFMKQQAGQDLHARMKRLEESGNDLSLLETIDHVVADRGLVEFRGAIGAILDRAEDKSFEIAVFGRVSSGKSSLLNAILDTGVLPIGVTPVTAVPVRITGGEEPSITVSFAGSPEKSYGIEKLGEFATEQENPGNRMNVSRITVRLPSPRLSEGISFVDTPGLGSLATSGASETLAYLPKCDLGVVLIDAGSTLTDGDLQTILALQAAAIPVNVLLSKADLLTTEDCRKIAGYVKEHIFSECHLDLPVYPVSSRPSHVHLSTKWFDDEILPLYSRLQELRASSLTRKISVLRESVVATLQFRITRSDRTPFLPDEIIRSIEERLRQARGLIEEIRIRCERITESMMHDSREIISSSANEAALMLSGDNAGLTEPGDVLSSAIASSVRKRAGEITDLLELLAGHIQGDLETCADETGSVDRPVPDEFLNFFRGMPVFDPGSISFSPSRPPLAAVLGEQYARDHLTARIRETLGKHVGQPYTSYTRLLEDWIRRETRLFAERFETYAGRYRAQAERARNGEELSVDEIRAIKENLNMLSLPAFPVSINGTAGDEKPGI
ncbi:MAG TPA: dynamin family protein [Methanoregulaceae archaeon]|nr:dynamin family protein [Methanoregulaceae archaeon]